MRFLWNEFSLLYNENVVKSIYFVSFVAIVIVNFVAISGTSFNIFLLVYVIHILSRIFCQYRRNL